MTRFPGVRSCRVATVFAALLLIASACGRHRQPAGDIDVPTSEIGLRIANHNYLDITIYVLHGGQRTRVGTVTGSSTQVFILPSHLLGQGREIELLGDPVGSSDVVRTERLVVQPGQYIDWTLETDLRRSSVGVY